MVLVNTGNRTRVELRLPHTKKNGFGDTGCGYGIELDSIPPAISSAPFKYIDQSTNKTYNMAFMGGIASLIQHSESLALEPIMGWAVVG